MRKILERQGYHLLAYLLLSAALAYAAFRVPGGHDRPWGLSASQWLALSWLCAGLSQAWVALFWRLELHHRRITGWMGTYGFLVHRAGYVALFTGRLYPLLPISAATAHTVFLPLELRLLLLVITLPLILWGLHGALFYFGLDRAAGIDHFDPTYREGDLEKRGIYRYVPNAMYMVVILIFFYPGLLWQSALGLITAGAHFAFVWVHYYCTEKPDLAVIYGCRAKLRP